MPLASNSLNMAGKSSKVGGTVARVFGWIILCGGLVAGFGAFATCGAIVGFAEAAPYVFGVPILAVSTIVGYLLLKSGKELNYEGEQTEKAARANALFALANTRGGVLTPMDVARAHNVSLEQADATLTELAKKSPDYVAVDIDDHGNVLYRFLAAATSQWGAAASDDRSGGDWRPRVAATPSNVRVGEPTPLDDDELPPESTSTNTKRKAR
ncbi:MAG: hypothetical protein FWD73_03635 [Polyangiaceae bacterium]|nr:hypothetical protein [Polyangiaceae bacterium]